MSESKTARKVYPTEFKKETLALIKEQGYTVKEAAEAAGIQEQLIYKWQKALDSASNDDSLTSDERQELLKLRRENKRLKMEQEILKKASAFFAKHMK